MGTDTLAVLPGTLELLILKTLSRGEAMHGFGVLGWIRETTGGALELEEGAVYPALHRMEGRGWLRSEWGVSEKGRRAKYYELTARGRTQLAGEERRWEQYRRAWDRISLAVAEG